MSKYSDAKKMYNTLINTLTNMGWQFDPEENNLIVRTSSKGKHIAIKIFIKVDEARSVMYLKSSMPFQVKESQRDLISNAVNVANYAMLNGCFEFDRKDGYLAFRMVMPFMESDISENACHYMVTLSCRMVDKFNNCFKSLNDGLMTLEEFEQYTSENF